jgi:hypothetical protein
MVRAEESEETRLHVFMHSWWEKAGGESKCERRQRTGHRLRPRCFSVGYPGGDSC